MLTTVFKYDPRLAWFYEPVESISESGEPITTPLPPIDTGVVAPFLKTAIRYMTSQSRELQKSGQQASVTTGVARIRTNSKSGQIKANWIFVHKEMWYEIVGFRDVPFQDNEIEFLYQVRTVGNRQAG